MIGLVWAATAMAGGDVLRVGAKEAYVTVKDAVDNAENGDTVVIVGGQGPEQDGSYRETVPIADLRIDIQGEERPVLRPAEAQLGFFEILEDAEVDVVDVVIDGGGTHRAFDISEGGSLTLRFSEVRQTRRDGAGGGAARVTEGGTLEVVESSFESSFATNSGGFFLVNDGADLTITNSVLRTGVTGQGGGAIFCETSGRCDIEGTTIAGSEADGNGGALVCRAPSRCTITDSVFLSNHTTAEGGAISQNGGAEIDITGTWFCQNSAGTGGALLLDGDARVERSVLMGNVAINAAGGVAARGNVELHFNDFVANQSRTGGALFGNADELRFTHNIFADHASADPVSVTNQGDPFEHRYNLYGGNSTDGPTVELDDTELAGDPLYVELDVAACNGSDLRLLPKSAAIDAGDPSLTDADGTVADIGAFGSLKPGSPTEPTSPTNPTDGPSRDLDEGVTVAGCSCDATSGAASTVWLLALGLLARARRTSK
ncbi:MAG: hypothetical protein KTR31_08130 [Myxococcales bacterium]|nr:hypothetical protein [Myxococcales bacterium]